MTVFSKRNPHFGGFYRTVVCISYFYSACCISCPFHSTWFYHPNNIWGKSNITKLLILQKFQVPGHQFFFRMEDKVSRPYNGSQNLRLITATVIWHCINYNGLK
jgi:hypothetical protein